MEEYDEKSNMDDIKEEPTVSNSEEEAIKKGLYAKRRGVRGLHHL